MNLPLCICNLLFPNECNCWTGDYCPRWFFLLSIIYFLVPTYSPMLKIADKIIALSVFLLNHLNRRQPFFTQRYALFFFFETKYLAAASKLHRFLIADYKIDDSRLFISHIWFIKGCYYIPLPVHRAADPASYLSTPSVRSRFCNLPRRRTKSPKKYYNITEKIHGRISCDSPRRPREIGGHKLRLINPLWERCNRFGVMLKRTEIDSRGN